MHELSSWHGTDLLPGPIIQAEKEAAVRSDGKYAGFLGTIQTAMVSKDVLVVDDDPHLCEIITDVLEAEGHIARMARNGEEALQRISERKPQLILLDLMMPVMNGWELAAALYNNPEWADIPIVVVTAAHRSATDKQPQLRAKAFIHKPFDIDALTEVVLVHAQ